MKRIAVLTSGGDAPGMNAAVRAITRYAISKGMEVFGVESGYQGLMEGDIKQFTSWSVSDILQRGGTVLKTSRSPEFRTVEGRKRGYETLKKHGIEGLVVIGGDGSFQGAKLLTTEFGIATMGIPGTIDNDLAYTDFTLGFDTAVNTVLDAINKLKDTMTSSDRVCILEVMGNKCGDIALYSGITGGAEMILVPEIPFTLEKVADTLMANYNRGKKSSIVVVAEGACKAETIEKYLKEEARTHNIQVRSVVLGHVQRGGSPTMRDRLLGTRFATYAVDLLSEGVTNKVIGIRDNKIIDMDLLEAVAMERKFDSQLYEIATLLA